MKHNDPYAVPVEMLEPGTSIHNCKYHNPGDKTHGEPWPWEAFTSDIFALHYDDHNAYSSQLLTPYNDSDYEDWEPLPCFNPSRIVWHVLGPVSAGSNSPTTSCCSVVSTFREKTTLYRVSRKEGLLKIPAFLIDTGPQGTKNKYLAMNQPERYWDKYIGLGKFKEYGVFIDYVEAMRYLNQLLSSDVNSLQEKIRENQTLISSALRKVIDRDWKIDCVGDLRVALKDLDDTAAVGICVNIPGFDTIDVGEFEQEIDSDGDAHWITLIVNDYKGKFECKCCGYPYKCGHDHEIEKLRGGIHQVGVCPHKKAIYPGNCEDCRF